MTPLARCRRPLAASLTALLLLSALGCAKTGSFLALNPRRSSMREQLSRLEFQNQQLKDELEVARQESRRLANDLQLAEIDKSDLKRQIESYQTQLGRSVPANSYDLARPGPGESTPEFRSTRPAAQDPNRPAPFTQIPNRGLIDVSPPPGPSFEDSQPSGTRRGSSYQNAPRPHIDPPPIRYFDLSPLSSNTTDRSEGAGNSPWSPIARGSSRQSW
ncbi:coiled-coil domain-containing protein [Tautonia sociabilis]|uniref:Uncharacterized protein n=1 Tax=Tautonia sociabilis TaxID=2080755 RepID=A0A432MFZ7_9BACT|nr:hypothetical protein [Tautonia sociabilis]RUL85062.1 hypothetical protein TsocGM_19165 [Tautonia sociabilis]